MLADAPSPQPVPAPDGIGIVWDDVLPEYDFGPFHPMAPIRLSLTRSLAGAAGVLDREGVQILPAPVASDEELGTVHDGDYIAAVRRASAGFEGLERGGPRRADLLRHRRRRRPALPRMHTASARIAGGSSPRSTRSSTPGAARGQHRRRPPPRQARQRLRLLRLQRRAALGCRALERGEGA